MNTEARIEIERTAITAAQAVIAELEAKRKSALLTDSDQIIDNIERDIDRARARISRSKDRIEHLEQQLSCEQQQAAQAELDSLCEKANKLRIAGERLIVETYGPAASTIAATLSKLQAIDDFIAAANQTLTKAGRSSITSANQIRCGVASDSETMQMRRVGIGEREHPMHGLVTNDLNGNYIDRNGTRVEAFVEVLVPTRNIRPAHMPEPLHRAVTLPGIDPVSRLNYWPTQVTEPSKLIDQLLKESKPLFGLLKSA